MIAKRSRSATIATANSGIKRTVTTTNAIRTSGMLLALLRIILLRGSDRLFTLPSWQAAGGKARRIGLLAQSSASTEERDDGKGTTAGRCRTGL